MSKRGYRCAAERKLVADARRNGWEVVERNGNNHLILRHANGTETQIPSDVNGFHIRRAAMNQLKRLAPWKD